MACYGYARVSTADQDCTLQEQALRAAGCEIIRAEKVSASRREGRTELVLLLAFLRPGDTLVVTRVDRLARRIKDLQDIVYLLKDRGVTSGRPSSRSIRSVRAPAVWRARSRPHWCCGPGRSPPRVGPLRRSCPRPDAGPAYACHQMAQ
jgi:hypothetical protein